MLYSSIIGGVKFAKIKRRTHVGFSYLLFFLLNKNLIINTIIAIHTIKSPNTTKNATPPVIILAIAITAKIAAIIVKIINNTIFIILLVRSFSIIGGVIYAKRKKKEISCFRYLLSFIKCVSSVANINSHFTNICHLI